MIIKFFPIFICAASIAYATETISHNAQSHAVEPIDFRTYTTIKNALPLTQRKFLTYTSAVSSIKLKMFQNCTDSIRVESIADFELLHQIANEYNISTPSHDHIIQFSRLGAATFGNLSSYDDSDGFNWIESPPQNSTTNYLSFSHVCTPLLNILTSLTQEILIESTQQAKTLYQQHHRTAENASDFMVSEANIFNDGGDITINLTDVLKPASEGAIFYFAPTLKQIEKLIEELPTNDCVTYYIIGYKNFTGVYCTPTPANQHTFFERIPSLEYIAQKHFISLGMTLISKGSLTIQAQEHIVLFSPHIVVLDIFHCIANRKYFLLSYSVVAKLMQFATINLQAPLFSIEKIKYAELKAAGITTIRDFHDFICTLSQTVGFHLEDPQSTNPERNFFILSLFRHFIQRHLISQHT